MEWFGFGFESVPHNWLIRSVPGDTGPRPANGNWVTSLNISSNFLREVPSVICQLTNLRSLDLSRNNLGSQSQPHRLRVEIFALPHLKKINLSYAELRAFPDVPEWSSAIGQLDLSSNHLRDLPESFGNAVTLDRLNLSSNKLREVPYCLGQLVALRSLDLSENLAITRLPYVLGNLTDLLELKHQNLDITDPPDSMLGKTRTIVHYLRNKLRDLKAVRAAKVGLPKLLEYT